MYLSASESPKKKKKRCARKGFEGALAASANLRKVIFLTFSAILLEFDKRFAKPVFKREVIMPLLFTEREKKKCYVRHSEGATSESRKKIGIMIVPCAGLQI